MSDYQLSAGSDSSSIWIEDFHKEAETYRFYQVYIEFIPTGDIGVFVFTGEKKKLPAGWMLA